MPKKRKPAYAQKSSELAKPVVPNQPTHYFDIYWVNQKPYCAYFDDKEEAKLCGLSKNAVYIEIAGDDIGFGRVVDFYRRDDLGTPIPATWTTEKLKHPIGVDVESSSLVLWWHLQKLYCGLFSKQEEADLQAMSRNGTVIEILSNNMSIGKVSDYWRIDNNNNPLPAEWLTARFTTV